MSKQPTDLGRRARELRELSGRSSRSLSELAGFSHSVLGQLERGEIEELKTEGVSKLAAVFGVSIDFLVRGLGEPPDRARVRAAVEAAEILGKERKTPPAAA